MRQFSILLTRCKNTVIKIVERLNKLENPDALRVIVQRQMYGLRQRRHSVTDKITKTQGWEITIVDLRAF